MSELTEFIKNYEENNEGFLKELQDGTMCMMDYCGSNVDDAFYLGVDYGEYLQAVAIVEGN